MKTVAIGLQIPFVGTAASAACVFLIRKALSQTVQKALSGFAAGVMVAASIWSLLIPAIPDIAQGDHSHVGVLLFSLGFTVMMALDVALG